MPKAPSTNQTSTQSSLLISEIKDGIVVMKDGSLRAVILASAINFDLMSSNEQNAVEYSYQGFLNSLHFPIQITVRSQKIDLDQYITKLDQIKNQHTNPLLAALMEDYIANIAGLVEEVNIMDKRFYVTVPYFPPLAVTKNNLATGMANLFKPSGVVTVGAAEFDQHKTELRQRVQQVSNGLNQMGIRAVPLSTQELIELFYAWYNPDVATGQKLIDATQFEGASVTRGGPPVQPPAAAPAPAASPPAAQYQPSPAAPPAPFAPAPAPTDPSAPPPPNPLQSGGQQ